VASYLVTLLPEYIAPNLLTLIGFLFTVVPFCLIYMVYGISFDGHDSLPKWLYVAQMLCYFLYRMFDEMDGKQARRTGSSSALGLIFDHGCDAFAIGF